MGNPSQLMQISFEAPLDETHETELSDAMSEFEVIENVRQSSRGGADKRHGYTLLSSDGTPTLAKRRLDSANAPGTSITITSRTAGRRLFDDNGRICVIDGTYLDSYSIIHGSEDAWVNKGRVPEASYRFRPVPSMGTEHPVTDCLYNNGLIFTANEFSTGQSSLNYFAIVTVIDANTNTVVRPPESLDFALAGSGLHIRLAAFGTKVFAVLFDAAAHTIKGWYLDTNTLTTIAAGWTALGASIATDWNANGRSDVVGCADRIAVIYANNGGTASRLTVKTVTTAGVQQTLTVNTSSIDPQGVSLSDEGLTTLWMAWAEETIAGPTHTTNYRVMGVSAANLSSTLASVATIIQTVRNGHGGGLTWIVGTSTTDAVLYAINDNVFAPDGLYVRPLTTSGGAASGTSAARKICNSTLAGRPFLRGGRMYGPLTSATNEEVALCDITYPSINFTWRPVCVPVQRGIYSLLTSNSRARTAVISSTKYVFAFNVLRAGDIFSGINGTALVEYDFANPYRWRPAFVNGTTMLSGGVTSLFDGRRVYEAAFLCRPPPVTIDVSAAGSQTFSIGRNYVLTYEEVDSNGNWHVSGVSTPVSSGAITSKRVILSAQPLTITSRTEDNLMPFGTGVQIGIWGTVNGGAEPYYRMGAVPNNPQAETITWEDTLSEAQFTSNQLLYGTGNLPGTGASQDHRAPPGLLHHVAYNGMLVGATGHNYFFSAQPIDGEGTWFSPLFSGILNEEITGLAVQDGAVVLFTTAPWVYITSGDPPSDNGQVGGLGTPRRVAVDFPCINANSIVTTSSGTFYQSDRGLELFTRGEASTYIGEAVQQTLDAYPVVTSAVLDAENGLVYFSLATSQTDGVANDVGVDIVFDLRPTQSHPLGFWVSRDVKTGTSASQASQDAAMCNVSFLSGARAYCWLATDGSVYFQSTTSYLDGSTWVAKAVETPTFRPNGIQGKMMLNRVLFLARKQTDSDLSVALSYDYSQSFKTARTWTATNVNTLLSAGLPITQLRHDAHDDNECQGVRIRITDATPTGGTVGTGRGAIWLGLTLDVTPRDGSFDVPEEAA